MKDPFLSCLCGKTFRSYSAEAVHRHNFPALCKPLPKVRLGKIQRDVVDYLRQFRAAGGPIDGAILRHVFGRHFPHQVTKAVQTLVKRGIVVKRRSFYILKEFIVD